MTVPSTSLSPDREDDVVLSVVHSSGVRELGRRDGHHLSTEVACGFTGRMLAVQAADGYGTVLSVNYTPTT